MPFGHVQISNHSLTFNDDVQLIYTIESHGRYLDIRNYHRSYLRLSASDQSRVLFRPISSTLERIANEAFPLPQRFAMASLLWAMHFKA